MNLEFMQFKYKIYSLQFFISLLKIIKHILVLLNHVISVYRSVKNPLWSRSVLTLPAFRSDEPGSGVCSGAAAARLQGPRLSAGGRVEVQIKLR